MKTMAAGAAAAGGVMLARGARTGAATIRKPGNHHLAWVWQFDDDGSPEEVRAHLAYYGVGILMKTHDATSWMARWDPSAGAVDGGRRVRELATFFEQGGVPFHAWAVVKGLDPIREAHMAAEVLANGARSMVFDLEPSDGGSFWQGTPEAATAFGRELRRLQPNAFLSFAPDPRPWQVEEVPAPEFARFCNEIAPQTYWPMFNTSANYRLLRERGFDVGPEGVTPEKILDVTKAVFAGYNLPIKPVGSADQDQASWDRFVRHAQDLGMSAVSLWRFGTAEPGVWSVLEKKRPNPNEYYGDDWAQKPTVLASSRPSLGSLPAVAPQAESPRVTPVLSKEATTSGQGITQDLDSSLRTIPAASEQNSGTSRKSFWADPLSRSGK